ncbi:Kv channel-interacting protein 1 [Apis florea]|uniref:Kv channel-interacting protein 1 n=1 Tax=Apis florea TaxID=7463 RepID=UPI0012FEAB84|nr:Kv channel-interacting protein 1 [Apis florea]XP_031773657.1 Kv channel-interacting protein 1 [Apis florea]
MEEDISSIEEQNKSCRTNKISHKSNIRKFFGNVWRRIKDEINEEERKRSNEYGDYYFYSEYEEEQTPRYRPDSLASLCRATRFTEAELKRIYRGFKAECPTGVVREETFKCIYSQFFPQGANTSQYAHYVFNTLDQDHSGILSFEDFVTGLSILSRGSIDEKLRWTFSLYDINGDGCITREEMTDIVTAVYELMGKFADPNLDHEGVREKVDRMFQKMDGNKDGVVTLSEFLEACQADPDISTSMAALDTAF